MIKRFLIFISILYFSILPVEAATIAFVWKSDTKISTCSTENIDFIKAYFTKAMDQRFEIVVPQKQYYDCLENNPNMSAQEFAANYGYDYVVCFIHQKGWIEHFNLISNYDGVIPLSDVSLSTTYTVSTPNENQVIINGCSSEKHNIRAAPRSVVNELFRSNLEYVEVSLCRHIFHDHFPQYTNYTETF